MTPEEIELLSELTIIIPTYNRPLELERSIEYWRDTPVTVHILDGSDKPWFPEGALPAIPNVHYHNKPAGHGDFWMDNYVERLDFATTLIGTKYSALCADDDLFSISGLCTSIRLLESDVAIDAVVGQTLGFFPRNEKVYWWLRYGVTSKANRFSRDPDPLMRLRRSNLRLFYGIVRTVLWTKRVQISKRNTWLGDRWETLFQEVSRILFRATSINQIVWYRFKTVRHKHEATHVYMREWANKKENYPEVFSYVNILVEATLLLSPRSDKSLTGKQIHKFLLHHPETRGRYFKLNHLRKALIIRFFSKFNENTVSQLPNLFREIVLRNYIPTKVKVAIGPKKVLSDFLPALIESGIEFDADELKFLESLLLKPREELRLRANI